MSGISALATIGGLGFAYALSEIFNKLPYDVYFVLGGIAIIAAGLVCSQLSTHAEGGKRERIVFRKEYGLYYILTFLEATPQRQILLHLRLVRAHLGLLTCQFSTCSASSSLTQS